MEKIKKMFIKNNRSIVSTGSDSPKKILKIKDHPLEKDVHNVKLISHTEPCIKSEILSTFIIKDIIRAVYDYASCDDFELSFVENEIMTVYHRDPSGWDEVVNKNGKRGWVPSNYFINELQY